VFGAFAAADADVVEWLLQRARTYMFTTASPPMLAAALLAALDLIESESWRQRHLKVLIERLSAGLSALPWRLLPSQTAIQPLIIGENLQAVSLMESLRRNQIWVPAIRPPTVPPGTARLRISLSAAHREQDVDRLLASLRALIVADTTRAKPA
jgi:8-amino-7-oxononanoate synthase